MHHWQYHSDIESDDLKQILRTEFGFHPVLIDVVARRCFEAGIGAHQISTFLRAPIESLDTPYLIPGVETASDLILRHVQQQNPLGIFGDYDVDGITGAAILTQFLGACGVPVFTKIPQRQNGYGLQADSIPYFQRHDCKLLITVDNGIAANKGVEKAKESGLQVIVTDHHQFDPENLPGADVLVHPGLGDSQGWAWSSGAGVALALVIAVRQKLRENNFFGPSVQEPKLGLALGFAALGTVCDIVPMLGVNRTIVKHGLQMLRGSDSVAIRSLCEVASINQATLDEQDLGFQIGPRINAAGRVGRAQTAFELLVGDDESTARQHSQKLDFWNQTRKQQEQQVLDGVEAELQAIDHDNLPQLICTGHPDWNQGVLGIVAGRIARKFHRPTILFQIDDQLAKGSARSIPGLDLLSAISAGQQHLVSFGGHTEAAGVSLEPAKLHSFRRDVAAYLSSQVDPGVWSPVTWIDAKLPIEQLSLDFMHQMMEIAPFGPKFRAPQLEAEALPSSSFRIIKRQHVGTTKLIGYDGTPLSAIGFGLAEKLQPKSRAFSFIYTPALNHFRGQTTVQALIRDLRPAG